LWALPLTLAGLAVAILGGARPSPFHLAERPPGALVFDGSAGLLGRFFRRTRYTGFGLGAVLCFAGWPEARLVRHEARHFYQARRLGIFLAVLYPLAGLVALALGRRGYTDNPFEIDARAAEAEEVTP
jgi:hypothetical protein